MNLTNTSQYAIRILSFMAIQKSDMVSAKYLIDNLNISDKYLRGLMTKLKKSGLVESIQGREGGYRISKPLNKLFLVEIIEAVEDIDKYIGCVLGFEECTNENPCAVHFKWKGINEDTKTFLSSTTLYDIVLDNSILKV